MKHLKKFLCIILVLLMIIMETGILSSCAKQSTLYVTTGEWLAMVDEAFGMTSYNSETPYIDSIDSSNAYFDAVQIACEWEVINSTDELDINQNLILSYALITLVNCGNFVDKDESDDTKISYAIENFDVSINKKNLEKKVDADFADELIASAKKEWAEYKYLQPIENISYAEGVKDYSAGSNIVDNYTVLDDGTISIPQSDNVEILENDIYILPSNGTVIGTNAYKAETVSEDDNYIYIKNSDEELDLYDIAQDINVEETFSPIMENTIVYDGNGEIISAGNTAVNPVGYVSDDSVNVEPLGAANNPKTTNCAATVSHNFQVDDFSVNLEYDLNGKFDLKATIESKNLIKNKTRAKTSSFNTSLSVGVSDLDVTQKVDYSWFKLKEATMKVDYKTETSLKIDYSKAKNETVAPKLSNGNGKFLANLKNSVLKDKDNAMGAKTIKICSLDVWSIGVCRLCLDVNLQVKMDGTVTVTVTENGTKGLEYRNGNIRCINTSDKDVNAEVKAKLEGTVGVGPALYVVGLKKAIIGAQIKFGVGAITSVNLHLADSENHLLEESSSFNEYNLETIEDLSTENFVADTSVIQEIAEIQGGTYKAETNGEVEIHIDRCYNVSAYFILKIELTDTSYAAELLGGKITVSWEIFGSENAKFLNIHFDNGKWEKAKVNWGQSSSDDTCTLKYTPFDTDEETTEATTEEYGSNKGFSTEHISYSINEGSSTRIVVDSYPNGYSDSDLVFESADESIASVSNDGQVTGKSNGDVIIKISTKDKKYYTECVVYVLENLAFEKSYSNNYEYFYV